MPTLHALDSELRMLILSLLSHNAMNVSVLTEALGLPRSTVIFNLKQLENVGLVHTQTMAGTRGKQKLIAKRYDEVHIKLPGAVAMTDPDVVAVSMPIGNYRFAEVKATCGLAGDKQFIGLIDDPRSFFEPDHVLAQLVWFRSGFIEYTFPNNLPFGARATEFELSVEICSKAPQYDPNWPSDITLWINDVEVCTWTSPGDFGGERGRLTPAWWPDDQTMYGLLTRWRVTSQGVYVNDHLHSSIKLEQLGLEDQNHISVRLGVKDDAKNLGGINLFGRRAGNYAQNLELRMKYEFADAQKPYQVR